MAKPFNELRERLLRAGVAPRHVRRYLTELADHWADLTVEEERAGRSRAEAESAALVRLGGVDDLARAMIEQRHFQSWFVRAPWAFFSLAPLMLLAAMYLTACLILWSGWKIFLPGADSPFVRVDGLAILYFGVGRLLYYSAPILVGWGIGLVAARQRLQALWPMAGLALIAWMSATVQIQAGQATVPGGLGHIRMNFFPFASSGQTIAETLLRALAILSLSALPFLLWRFKRAHSVSA
jgi:hypothetical protein